MTRLFIPVALAATLLTPGAAYALTCADYASPVPVANNSFDQTTVPLPVDLVAGDTVTVSISWQRTTATPATATLTLKDGVTTLGTASLPVGGSGPLTDFAAIAITAAVQFPDAVISVPNTNSANTYAVRLSCVPAAPGGGDGGGDGGGAGSGDSATLDTIQHGQGQATAFRAVDMISSLARGGIDAAFADDTDTTTMAFGYAGAAIIDVTPAELASGGFNLWTGASYQLAIPDAGQWEGGQASVAGGLNYRVDERWIVGVFAAYDQAGYRLDADSLASRGVALGVTSAFRLDDTWRVELIGVVERLRYDLEAGAVTGDFDATRVTLDGTLKGVVPVSAQVDFVPSASLMVLREDQAGYTDSASVAHASSVITSGQLSTGGHFVFYPTSGLDATFSLGGSGHYTFATTADGFSASLDAGIAFTLAPSATLSLNVSLNGIADPTGAAASVQAKLGGAL